MALPIPGIDNIPQEQYDALPLVSSAQQAYVAAFDLAMEDTGSMLLARPLIKNDLENRGTVKLSPEDLNKKYPDMTAPFRQEMSEYSAQMLYTRDQEKKRLQERIAAGPQDNWNKSKQFGVGLLAHAMDPLEFGVGAVAGWGVGALVGRGAFGLDLAIQANVSNLATTPLKSKLLTGAIETGVGNLAENLVSEGMTAAVLDYEGAAKYDPKQGLVNLTVGTFFGMVPMLGAKFLGKGATVATEKFEGYFLERKLMKMLQETSPEADRQLVTTSIAAAADNKVPNPERLIKQLAGETSVDPTNPLRGEYSFKPLTPGEAKKLYMVRNAGGFKNVGDGMGMGRQLTDDPLVAQAAAQRPLSDGANEVVEIDVADLNPLNLNQAFDDLPANVKQIIDDSLELAGDTPNDFRGSTVAEVFEYINALKDEDIDVQAQANLVAKLKELGYDSTVHDGSSRMGFDHSKHNVVEIFDDAKIGEGRPVQLDPAARQDFPRPEDVEAARAEAMGFENRWDFDAEKARADFDETEKIVVSDKFDESALREADEIVEDFSTLDKLDELQPWQRDALDDYKNADAQLETKRTLIKAAAQCLLGN